MENYKNPLSVNDPLSIIRLFMLLPMRHGKKLIEDTILILFTTPSLVFRGF